MKQIGRNIISLLFSRVIAGIILFLIYTRLLQYFGPTIAGQYGLLAAYLTVFNFFVDLGMQQLVIKKVSENKDLAEKYLSNYFGIQFLLGFGFMIVMDILTIIGHYPPIVRNSLYITGLSLLLSSLSMPFMAIINAYQRLGVIAKVNFLNSIINASMMGITIWLHKNIFFMSFVNVIAGVVDFLIYWYVVEKGFVRFRLKFDFKFWKTLLALNLPFIFLTFFSIYNRIDTLLLPHLRNFTENGYYTAVYKFWDTLAFLPAIVSASLYPFFSESLMRNELANIRKGLESYTRYMIALALPLAVGAFMLQHRLTVDFFGPAFAPAASALWLLVAAVGVLFIYSPVNSLIVSQKTTTAMKITGFNLFFNIVMNLILIPKFGFVAAAVMTLASECIQWVGYTIVINKSVIRFKSARFYIKPIISCVIMAVTLLVLKNQNLWLQLGVAAIVYFAVLLLLQFFKQEDFDLLFGGIKLNPVPTERDVT